MISVTGVREIDAVLKGLPLQVTDRVMQAAHSLAAQPLINAAHLLAPVGKTGNLADAIGKERVGMARATNIGEVKVGPRRTGTHRGHHGHLIEYGTQRRSTSSGANRGAVRAKPFMRPAFERTQSQITEIIRVAVAQKLVSFMKRTIKNA